MPRVIDLSHAIAPGMPVYPGTEPPVVRQANTIERNGFAEKQISMYSHTGTHVDAPAHMLAGASTLDALGVAHFVGRACVVDVSQQRGTVERATLEAHADRVARCRFVLLHTGWSAHWGRPGYFSGFPVLSRDAAAWLAGRGLHGVGLDVISADPVEADVYENHQIFFRAGMVIVENLTGLEALIGRAFLFSCLPLALEDADGSPVRAVAILEDGGRDVED